MTSRNLFAFVFLAPLAASQTCPVWIDINTNPVGLSSTWEPGEYDLAGAPNGDLFFAGHQQATGTELWRTDGTPAGTVLVADLLPGDLGTFPQSFCAANGWVFFSADNGTHGRELWRSDGTAAGTMLVADIEPGPGDSNPRQLLAFGGAVYFQAYTTFSGYELWRSDGTAVGTTKLKEIYVGSNSGSPANLTLLPSGNGFVFRAFTGAGGEPWFSDGTPAGTLQLKDINLFSGTSLDFSTRFVPFGGELYFSAKETFNGPTLWKTDGTPNGTVLVSDPTPSTSLGPSTSEYALFNGEFYFSGSATGQGTELWKSDGTALGTQLVVDLLAGTSSSSPTEFTVLGSELYFFAKTGATYESALMATGGTAATTRTVRVLPIQSSGQGTPRDMSVVNGRLVFSTGTDPAGRELWSSDGTTAGTQLIVDLNPGVATGNDSPVHLVSPNLGVLMGLNATTGREVFATDGLSVSLVKDLQPGQATLSSNPRELTAIGNDLYFSATEGVSGDEPYRIDASGALVALGDIQPGALGSSPELFTPVVVGNQQLVFFTALENATGRELYVTDGAPNQITFLGDLTPGFLSSEPTDIAGVNGLALFSGNTMGSGYELWRSDGSAAGTQELVEINPGGNGSFPGPFVDMGATLLFPADVNGVGRELFVTDGTAAGTQMVVNLTPGGSTNPLGLTRLGDRAVFFGRLAPSVVYGLFETDGTAAGTQLISDLGGALYAGPYDELPVVNGQVFFLARDAGGTGRELWRSDLTAAGTHPVADLSPGATDTNFATYQPMVATRNQLFFVAEASVGGFGEELYVTDGTLAGTHLVQDLAPGSASAGIQEMVGLGAVVYVSAYPGPTQGRELYVSDGNTMTLVCDPSPGSALLSEAAASSSAPSGMTPYRGELVFAASAPNAVSGELFRLTSPGAYSRDLTYGDDAFELAVDAPLLGSSTALIMSGGFVGNTHLILSSSPIANPLVGSALVPSHWAWVNPGAFTILLITTATEATLPIAVPVNPALTGVRLHVQAVAVDPLVTPGLRTSNGCEVVVGP